MSHYHQAQSLVEATSAPKRRRVPWITITGGKGGVGKTIISVNVAALAARAGYRTLLLDLDPGLANLDVHLRLAPEYTVEDLQSTNGTKVNGKRIRSATLTEDDEIEIGQTRFRFFTRAPRG